MPRFLFKRFALKYIHNLCKGGGRLINRDSTLLTNQKSWLAGVFINPTNGRLDGSEFTLVPKPPGASEDYFVPPLTSIGGANYFDRDLATLFVVVRGSIPVEIRVMPVVQVTRCINQ